MIYIQNTGKVKLISSTLVVILVVFFTLRGLYWNGRRQRMQSFPLIHGSVAKLVLPKTNQVYESGNLLFPKTTARESTDVLMYKIQHWWEAEALYDKTLQQNEYKCLKITRHGTGGGVWNICEDHVFKPRKPSCLVYSFGIANDFSFDDSLANMSCMVHSFDPSMNKPDHKHAKLVWFHDLGLGDKDTNSFSPRKDIYVKKKATWKIRRMSSIIKELGHKGKELTILKVDIEGYEFQVIKDMLKSGVLKRVRQFVIEFHIFDNARYDMITRFRITRDLYNAGFRRFYTEKLIYKCPYIFCNQHNIGYVKINFIPESSRST